MFDKPNRSDVVRELSYVAANAGQVATDERARVEQTFAKKSAATAGGMVNYIAQAIDEAHIRWMKEAMRILASFVGKVDADPKEMSAWARVELVTMADLMIREIESFHHEKLAASLREHCGK